MIAALSLLLTAVQSQAPPAGEIIGYRYTCSAEVPVGSTKLQGALVLAENGTHTSFSAQYWGERGEIDQLFFLESWDELRRRGIESHLRWSLFWDARNLAMTSGNRFPAFEDAWLRLAVSTRRRLPKTNFLALSNDYEGSGLITEADRWPGRKTGAEFSFRAGDVLRFKGDARFLKWRLLKPPLPTGWAFASSGLRASGHIELDAVRKMERPFDELRDRLLAKARDYRQACQKVPVHYDPLSEI